MRVIDSKTHGIIDYLTGLLFIASPWIFGFQDIKTAMWVPVIIGVMVLVMSLMTRYELGIFYAVPFTVHLTVDLFAGLFLIASPWIFGFADLVIWPHVLFGIIAVGVSMMTRRNVRDPQLRDV